MVLIRATCFPHPVLVSKQLKAQLLRHAAELLRLLLDAVGLYRCSHRLLGHHLSTYFVLV